MHVCELTCSFMHTLLGGKMCAYVYKNSHMHAFVIIIKC